MASSSDIFVEVFFVAFLSLFFVHEQTVAFLHKSCKCSQYKKENHLSDTFITRAFYSSKIQSFQSPEMENNATKKKERKKDNFTVHPLYLFEIKQSFCNSDHG